MAIDGIDSGTSDGTAIQSVARAADIIRLLTSGESSISVAETSKALGLQRTTTHRYMTTLLHVGFLQREKATGRYTLGPLAHQVFTAVLRDRQILTIAPSRMQAIADQTSTSTALCLWGGNGALVAHMAYPAASDMSVRVPIGLRVDPDGAQTLMFLAFNDDNRHAHEILDTVPESDRKRLDLLIARARADHFLQVDDRAGIRIIAAPVFDARGICATLAMLSTVNRLAPGPLSLAALSLRRAAVELSVELGYQPDRITV
jgi:DNA-binding IclR family transcriptional regulator